MHCISVYLSTTIQYNFPLQIRYTQIPHKKQQQQQNIKWKKERNTYGLRGEMLLFSISNNIDIQQVKRYV